MGVFFYNIFLLLFKAGVRITALFNTKASKWVRGRRNIFPRLRDAIAGNQRVIWMHCASLGEFEQGRPLLERLRKDYPEHKLLLTFFSPSGYEVRKDYKGADWVFYLPMDGMRNAREFLAIVNPVLVIFVKYEFWYYYLKKVKYRETPLILVSALFWEKMSFFKWYGALQRKILSRFDQLFVQDNTSKKLLDQIGLSSITRVSGDTRFDRVIEIAASSPKNDIIAAFSKDARVLVAGSTWPADEQILKELSDADPDLKLIIAPHEIGIGHINSLLALFPGAARYSEAAREAATAKIMIIDNIGLLSGLYKYAYASYIGGGFGKGIHNTLEAAVYGRPVIFGPVFHKFKEAKDLIANGGAFTISNSEDFITLLSRFGSDADFYKTACENASAYVFSNRGATDKIVEYIQEKRLLTN